MFIMHFYGLPTDVLAKLQKSIIYLWSVWCLTPPPSLSGNKTLAEIKEAGWGGFLPT